jgi:hypothetical protein
MDKEFTIGCFKVKRPTREEIISEILYHAKKISNSYWFEGNGFHKNEIKKYFRLLEMFNQE